MKESIFRKESLERISSPGELNQYIRVADPGTWLMLAAIVVLLLGVLVWGVFGEIETVAPACAAVDENGVVCYVKAQDADRIQPGMAVRIGKEEGVIIDVSGKVQALPEDVQAVLHVQDGCAANAEFEAEIQGICEAEVILEQIAPVSFVIQ